MPDLPIRRMILYKHGVGYFERGGAVSGTELRLSFPRAAMDDVLKSLVALDLGAGQVRGVDFETPEDRAALELAAELARHSLHPLSRALVAAAISGTSQAALDARSWEITDLREAPGSGLTARVRKLHGAGPARTVLLGSAAHAGLPAQDGDGAQVCMAWADQAGPERHAIARFEFEETLRSELPAALRALERAGIAVQVLSGDRAASVARVAPVSYTHLTLPTSDLV